MYLAPTQPPPTLCHDTDTKLYQPEVSLWEWGRPPFSFSSLQHDQPRGRPACLLPPHRKWYVGTLWRAAKRL